MEPRCKTRKISTRFSAILVLLATLPVAVLADEPPPRDEPLLEKSWEALSNQDAGDLGRKALAIKPEKWKHAETENFIVHFRRATEAKKVVREVEYTLWYVATALGAGKERYQRKSHVFVFKDEAEWQSFLAQAHGPPWSHSFAHGDELFLNVRGDTGLFDSNTLAHETTHAVVARLYPTQRWPVWLNEGFAEYMGSASVAARLHFYAKTFQKKLQAADLPIEELTSMPAYPEDENKVPQLYQSSEKLVRFLMDQPPKDRFVKFIDAVLRGRSFETAVTEVYGDKFKDFETFKKKYASFVK
jgi:hypothetical protein